MSSEKLALLQRKGGDYVLVLSEVAFDAAYFNEAAWKNLLRFLAKNSWITGVIVDGPWTRLDRPEILNSLLTYWDLKSEEECKEASERVPNWEQVQHMQRIQFEILGKRLAELRAAAPKTKIVLSIHSDDTHHAVSAVLHELLISRQVKIESSVDSLKGKRSTLVAKAKALNQQSRSVAKQLRSAKKGANAKPAAQRKLNKLTADLAMVGTNIREINQKIGGLVAEAGLFREKKTRPTHQFVTKDVVQKLHASVKAICDANKAEFTSEPGVLVFGDLIVDYSHSRHKTWIPVLDIENKLVASTHGNAACLQKAYAAALNKLGREAMKTGVVDVILESGHHGKGFKQFQLLRVPEDATNFKDQMKYASGRTETYTTLVCALPFEDQELIARFVDGKEPERMSLGKPMSTRKHAAFDRDANDSVSGVTIIGKLPGAPSGMVMTRWIQYHDFIDGSVLSQPDEYAAVTLSGDEHIGSRESRPAARAGLTLLHRTYTNEAFGFCGRPARLKGYLNVGDIAEANSRKWTFRGYDERDPDEVIAENIVEIAKLNPEDPEAVLKFATKCTNDSMGGSVESMDFIKDLVMKYQYGFLAETLRHSTLKVVHAAVPGNHADDVQRDMGEKETSHFRVWCKAKDIPVYEVGKSDYFNPNARENGRVWLGGYSSARIVQIDDYGMDVHGKPLFGPFRIVIQHDPKNNIGDGVEGTAKSACADVAFAGHTHENRVRLFRTERNKFGLAYRSAAMQGHGPVAAYYGGSVPRTAGAHFVVLTKPGDVGDITFSADYLEGIREEELRAETANSIKQRKGNSAK